MSETVLICGVAYSVAGALPPRESDGRRQCRVETLNGVCTAVAYDDGWYIVSDFPRKEEPCKTSAPPKRKRS